MKHSTLITRGSRSNEHKTYQNNTKILNKNKNIQIICMVAKLKYSKGEPNKTNIKLKKLKKLSDNCLSNSDYSHLRTINLH
jgi:hypothetical protein